MPLGYPVLTPVLHRLTAWLCLVVALYSGLAPAQRFVLCLEPDGCVTPEVAAGPGRCGSCEPHREASSPAPWALLASLDAGCPCVDFRVQGTPEDQRVQQRRTRLPERCLAALPPASGASGGPERTGPPASLAPWVAAPRPAGSLLLIRSVVLRV